MCPSCRSQNLRIRKLTGFERFMVLMTNERKYYCSDCSDHFRAPDRRNTERGGDALNAARAVGLLRQ